MKSQSFNSCLTSILLVLSFSHFYVATLSEILFPTPPVKVGQIPAIGGHISGDPDKLGLHLWITHFKPQKGPPQRHKWMWKSNEREKTPCSLLLHTDRKKKCELSDLSCISDHYPLIINPNSSFFIPLKKPKKRCS